MLTWGRGGDMDAVENEAVEKLKGGKEGGAVGMARHSGQWRIVHKHFFMQQGKLTCADYHKGTGMLVAGFSTGIFTLYQMPGFEMVHTLSVSRERLSSVKFSDSGDWCVGHDDMCSRADCPQCVWARARALQDSTWVPCLDEGP